MTLSKRVINGPVQLPALMILDTARVAMLRAQSLEDRLSVQLNESVRLNIKTEH